MTRFPLIFSYFHCFSLNFIDFHWFSGCSGLWNLLSYFLRFPKARYRAPCKIRFFNFCGQKLKIPKNFDESHVFKCFLMKKFFYFFFQFFFDFLFFFLDFRDFRASGMGLASKIHSKSTKILQNLSKIVQNI